LARFGSLSFGPIWIPVIWPGLERPHLALLEFPEMHYSRSLHTPCIPRYSSTFALALAPCTPIQTASDSLPHSIPRSKLSYEDPPPRYARSVRLRFDWLYQRLRGGRGEVTDCRSVRDVGWPGKGSMYIGWPPETSLVEGGQGFKAHRCDPYTWLSPDELKSFAPLNRLHSRTPSRIPCSPVRSVVAVVYLILSFPVLSLRLTRLRHRPSA